MLHNYILINRLNPEHPQGNFSQMFYNVIIEAQCDTGAFFFFFLKTSLQTTFSKIINILAPAVY